MNLESELAHHTPGKDSVLTVGVFDGIHRGHLHLLSVVLAEARRKESLAGVVTFRTHPASVLRPDLRPRLLTTLARRLSLIEDAGIDFVVPISFDLEVSGLRAGQFLALLHMQLQMRELVVGPDFAMGRQREAGARELTDLGRTMGFSVRVVEPLIDEGGWPIRSTSVREALAQGDVERVAALLGRNFTLEGTVVKGTGRGGPLGFPTANVLAPPEMAIPGDGIYAAWVHLGAQRHMAAVSLGVRPTFDTGEHAIEAYILDFDGDLYGENMNLEFVARLRDDIKFDSVRALQEQVDRDVHQTRTILQDISPGDE